MTRGTFAGAALVLVFLLILVLFGLVAFQRARTQNVKPAAATSTQDQGREHPEPATTPSPAGTATAAVQGFLYGRVTTIGRSSYEGRLRFGRDQEAFWGDYFNGFKEKNPWLAHVPPEQRPKESRPIKFFGFEIGAHDRPSQVGRPFMARLGDIARIEAGFREVWVTLKSGTVFVLDAFEASDHDDGVRVWDAGGGAVDLDWVRTIEFLPTAPWPAGLGAVPNRLHGTVRTRQGDFTGFVQWDREECVGSDELDGRTAEGELKLSFDTIRSIARGSPDSSLVTVLGGREITLSGTREVGKGNRGIYVDDPRYGRVLISWDAFERIDFTPAGSGPAYDDFLPGRPLTGSLTTRTGRRLAGRLVYDLDESETTETLDAPSQGVDYTIPFGLVASIALPGQAERDAKHARVTLQSGEELQLELNGDLGEENAGMLIFVDGQRPEYVPWTDVQEVEFDRPAGDIPAARRTIPQDRGEP